MPKIVHPKLMGRVSGLQDPFMMFAQSLTLGLVALLFPKFVSNIDYLYYGMGVIILLVLFLFCCTAKIQCTGRGSECSGSISRATEEESKICIIYVKNALFLRKSAFYIQYLHFNFKKYNLII